VPLASAGYTGVFDGGGHTISSLSIDRPGETNVGLFARIDTGTIRDLTLSDVAVNGTRNVGGLAGLVTEGIGYINNVSVSGAASGIGNIGLLIGSNGGLVGNVHSSGTVYGDSGAGASISAGWWAPTPARSATPGRTPAFTPPATAMPAAWSAATYVGPAPAHRALLCQRPGLQLGRDRRRPGRRHQWWHGDAVVRHRQRQRRPQCRRAGRPQCGGRQHLQCLCEWRGERQQRRSPDSHAHIGGLVGELYSGYVSSVYSAGTLDAGGFTGVGGLVGSTVGGSLSAGYFNRAAGTSADGAGATG
jgi:hypothetical protein